MRSLHYTIELFLFLFLFLLVALLSFLAPFLLALFPPYLVASLLSLSHSPSLSVCRFSPRLRIYSILFEHGGWSRPPG
jgi:hypothetical protein